MNARKTPLILWALPLALSLALVGCGNDKPAGAGTDTREAAEQQETTTESSDDELEQTEDACMGNVDIRQ